jgi:hypothetical protein
MRQAMPIAECLALGGFASAQAGLNTHWRMRHRLISRPVFSTREGGAAVPNHPVPCRSHSPKRGNLLATKK